MKCLAFIITWTMHASEHCVSYTCTYTSSPWSRFLFEPSLKLHYMRDQSFVRIGDLNTVWHAIRATEHCLDWKRHTDTLIHALKTSSPWRVDASLKLLWSRRLEAHSRDTWRFLGDQQSVQVSVSSMWTPDGNAAAADDGKWILRMHWRRTESRRCLASPPHYYRRLINSAELSDW